MKALKCLGHVMLVTVVLMLLAGIPVLTHFDLFGTTGDTDAVSTASIPLPDQPSGDFVVLMRTSMHEETIDDWKVFFTGEDLPVIFDDISCLVAEGDVNGQQLAERFQVLLPENQMKIRTENPTLLASKVEAGYIDVAVFSREMADALDLSPEKAGCLTVMIITGDE